MMDLLNITKKNESELILETNNLPVLNNIKKYFSCKMPGYQFSPKYKKTGWNGDIQFIKSNSCPYGLIYELIKYLKNNEYEYKLNFPIKFDIPENLDKFIEDLKLPYPLHSYQLEAIKKIFKYKKVNIELPTGSGKTLIIYIITRFLLNQKTLIIVPRISLLEQMYGDFKNYGFEDISKYVFCKYSGESFDDSKNVYISTWQSVYKLTKENPKFFQQFKTLIIDEAHTTKGVELQNISKCCNSAEYKIGFSGTFGKEREIDWFSEVSSLGPVLKFTDYKELQELKQIPLFKVKIIKLKYSQERMNDFYEFIGKDFFKENEFLRNLPERNNFLIKLSKEFTKNSVFLFTLKEKHGRLLYEEMKKINDKIVFYIDGDSSLEDRENVKGIIESNDNVVGLASFGIFDTGISVKNIHNIILASNYKSRIKILQAIGRSLRTHKNKNMALIFDIVDDFSSNIYQNFSIKHMKERIKTYKEKSIPYEVIDIQL